MARRRTRDHQERVRRELDPGDSSCSSNCHHCDVDVADHIAALDLTGRRFTDLLANADLDAAVPPCPGWDVRELARHLGGIHRWATRYVSEARTSVTPFAADFAADGIDELLTAFITRPGRGPRAEGERRLAILSADDSARWTVRFDADSCDTVPDAGAADVRVTGAASDLYLWVWNRPTIGEVTIAGDRSVAKVWKDTVHVRWS